MEKSNHFFYVLECKDGSLYAGYTNNLEKRLKLHNEGKAAKYTRGRGPVKLVYSQQFNDKSEALKAEYQFKKWTRKKKEEYLMKETGGLYVAAKKFSK
ncbi:GIY-YIG nuclease family protein [Bacillus methanolicus]|uniref:GIY-YIG nuclease superfamily protein n=1 Tax=Bacillus methanolicus (strain MGA3 / ATCC 53907) TaxID=796606 RepID=I3EC19_BACMM|nr:GIY-YIG nuclease family protein [Bacillus methanolicus]AIE58562.1 GIY-YIG nuclease superfamily protein [Bacillus methanolicus MGA3]EIJ84040.1 GIY-YIG nuclease superfamily protein [Bacillus methanolicus MGA3]UQD50657.1 GIY-YIG nuclease family protein [Bacillus methanolicus]